jgi:glutathione S-transferase
MIPPLVREIIFSSAQSTCRKLSVSLVQSGISLTESNTIAKYLVDQYDKDNNLFIRSVPEEYILLQWLHFQGATQGTIFQQA